LFVRVFLVQFVDFAVGQITASMSISQDLPHKKKSEQKICQGSHNETDIDRRFTDLLMM